jgi:hypothetical protein
MIQRPTLPEMFAAQAAYVMLEWGYIQKACCRTVDGVGVPEKVRCYYKSHHIDGTMCNSA